MKTTIKHIMLALVAITILASCEENKPEWDGSNTSSQSLIGFDHSSYNFKVPEDSSTTFNIQFSTSTLSDQDRTFGITVVEDGTIADPSTYNVPEQVTIPAGKYTGTLSVDGEDPAPGDLVTIENKPLRIAFSNSNNYSNMVTQNDTITLNQYQVCPVPEDYLIGDYQLENLTQTLGPANDVDNITEGIVTLEMGDDSTERTFQGDLLGFGAKTVTIALKCGVASWAEMIELNVTCSGGDDENDLIAYGPASGDDDQGSYDIDEPNAPIIVYYIEDAYNDCGAQGVASFKLTPVN